MSNLSWQSSLVQTAERLQPRDRPLRIAVVGVGHELRGDDAVGVVAARSLIAALADPTAKNAEATQEDFALSAPFAVHSGAGRDGSRQSQQSHLLVIDAGPAPENYTGSLRRFQPDLVILVDAAQMGETPGAIRWLRWQDTDGLSASTHTLPAHVLARYLTVDLGCQVALLGIQPAGTCIGAPLSPTAQMAVKYIVNVLDGLSRKADGQDGQARRANELPSDHTTGYEPFRRCSAGSLSRGRPSAGRRAVPLRRHRVAG